MRRGFHPNKAVVVAGLDLWQPQVLVELVLRYHWLVKTLQRRDRASRIVISQQEVRHSIAAAPGKRDDILVTMHNWRNVR